MPHSGTPRPATDHGRRNLSIRWLTISISLLVLGAVLLGGFWWWSANKALLGVWQATDMYGGQHFYEFQPGGKVRWWDLDRTDVDGQYTKRGPFQGTYRRQNGAVVVMPYGLFAEPVGSLRWKSPRELSQADDGHFMRRQLIYKKLDQHP